RGARRVCACSCCTCTADAGACNKDPPRQRPIHDWPLIERLDAEFCLTYCAETRRPPSWKERRAALAKKLGTDTPHLKTLQRRLPKIALLKERNSRSI